AKILLSGVEIQNRSINIDTDQKGFTFNGKSGGIINIPDSNRKERLNDLTSATKGLEDTLQSIKKDDKEDAKN
ncbi:MAG: hypothetical protein ABIO44_12755, partial [Saprospiraceae bacterium]